MDRLNRDLKSVLVDVIAFVEEFSDLKLRKYQEEVAWAVVDSVFNDRGLTIVVMFPRQSGKNELQAQIEAYLMSLYMYKSKELVKVSPTWKPQSLNAMRRLERVMARNLISYERWSKEDGYVYRMGGCRIFFLSGAPTSNVVGATANLLLQCDEAQDVPIAKWDKDFAPMAASTRATRVFWGTAWTSRTLLARELKAAREEEKKDGIKRVFTMTADDVAEEVPDYRQFVAEQVARFGRNHPLVKTQYFSEEIDAEGGMFPAERRRLMQGEHDRALGPRMEGEWQAGIYAFLIDVAGVDESATDMIKDMEKDYLRNPARNATALTIVEVDLSSLGDEVVRAPTYKVVGRRSWGGVSHTTIYGEMRALADLWHPRFAVVDATGVGVGLTSFLSKALPGRVLPYTFTAKSKSDLGWNFLAVCDTGRFKDHRSDPGSPEQAEFWNQLAYVQYEAEENKMLKWSVPDGTRDPASGDLVHDDLVISAALCAALDEQPWSIGGPTLIVPGRDPLEEMDRASY